jgi:hypothetical protein
MSDPGSTPQAGRLDRCRPTECSALAAFGSLGHLRWGWTDSIRPLDDPVTRPNAAVRALGSAGPRGDKCPGSQQATETALPAARCKAVAALLRPPGWPRVRGRGGVRDARRVAQVRARLGSVGRPAGRA